jgi:hypothetical protein
METNKLNTAFFLSGLVAILAIIASAAGLFANVYRDNAMVTAAYRGNDLITLSVVAPLLLVALMYSRRGSARWLLIWVGSVAYMLYNYIFYVYGAAFNPIFLLYVLLVGVSLWALILSMPRLDAAAISRQFSSRTPVRWIAGFMLLIPVIIGGVELMQIASYFADGKVPQAIAQTGHPTGVIYATDLAFLMPAIVVGAVLLWQRKPWGYVLGTIVMLKGVTYPLALVAMVVFSLLANTGYDELLPVYIFFLVGSVIALGLLLRNLQPGKPALTAQPAGIR